VFDSQKRHKNYKNPLNGSLHTSRGLRSCRSLADWGMVSAIWTLVVNPDGTTSAWNKNKTKVLHSHGPPARAA